MWSIILYGKNYTNIHTTTMNDTAQEDLMNKKKVFNITKEEMNNWKKKFGWEQPNKRNRR